MSKEDQTWEYARIDAEARAKSPGPQPFVLKALNNPGALVEALRRVRDFPHNDTICEQAMSQIAREALRTPALPSQDRQA